MDILNFAEIAAFLSVFGGACFFLAARVKKSRSWEASSGIKKVLLITTGVLLQVPILLVIIFKPPYVSGVLAVEEFRYSRLLLIYAVVIVLMGFIRILNRFTGR